VPAAGGKRSARQVLFRRHRRIMAELSGTPVARLAAARTRYAAASQAVFAAPTTIEPGTTGVR
jgi:hypothetical protein